MYLKKDYTCVITQLIILMLLTYDFVMSYNMEFVDEDFKQYLLMLFVVMYFIFDIIQK